MIFQYFSPFFKLIYFYTYFQFQKQKGKSDCLDLGKALNEKYGRYFKRKADDLATILDDRPSSADFIQYTLLGLFGSAPLTVIGQFSGHKEMVITNLTIMSTHFKL